MARIVRLPVRPPAEQSVTALAAQLSRVEGAESPDEATMDAITEAEQRLLTALASARSLTLAEVAQKLTTIIRRSGAADGFLSETDQDLLQSTLRDLRGFDPMTAAA